VAASVYAALVPLSIPAPTMHLCLFEDDRVDALLPLAATRAVYDLRLGIRTLLETTRDAFGRPPTVLHARPLIDAVTALEHGVPINHIPDGADVLFVNGRFIAEEGDTLTRLRQAARAGEPGRVFVQDGDLVAAWVPGAAPRLVHAAAVTRTMFDDLPEETVEGARWIRHLWHLIDEIEPAIGRDFGVRTAGADLQDRSGATIHARALLTGDPIYVAPGATIRPGAILDAEGGPIYIDAEAVVMEHAVVKGPAYVGPKAQVKIGGLIEGSVIGPVCKAGGEIEASLMHSFSNKQHSGFLGHSYLGRWINLGADANTSDLRNDYGFVTLYNAAKGVFEPTERRFLGVFIGDHSKGSINTMFNTATVVGVSCNIYGAGFPPRYLPSFSWGSPEAGFVEYRLEKALQVAEAVMARRGKTLSEAERAVLTALFEART